MITLVPERVGNPIIGEKKKVKKYKKKNPRNKKKASFINRRYPKKVKGKRQRGVKGETKSQLSLTETSRAAAEEGAKSSARNSLASAPRTRTNEKTISISGLDRPSKRHDGEGNYQKGTKERIGHQNKGKGIKWPHT